MQFSDFIKPCRIIRYQTDLERDVCRKKITRMWCHNAKACVKATKKSVRPEEEALCKSCNPAGQLERTVWWHDPQLWNFKMWFHVRRCIGDEENLPYCSNNGKIRIHFCFKMTYDIRYIRLEICRPSSSLIQITPGRSSSVNWKPLAKARHGGRWHGTGIGYSSLEDLRGISMVFLWYLYGFCVVCL